MSDGDDQHMDANRRSWDARTPTHFGSRFYGVDGFKAGASSLNSLEIEGVGDVDGKSLLHLQCHFGMDTMSWARLGAVATGVDFSEEAISRARSLSGELGIDAKFVVSNVYDLPEVLDGRFDVVFTSYGVLTWLPDLERWANVIAHFLEQGGVFYILDAHPFGNVFYDEDDAVDLRPFYPYSTRGTGPLEFPPGSTYTDGPDEEYGPTFEWGHSVGDILNREFPRRAFLLAAAAPPNPRRWPCRAPPRLGAGPAGCSLLGQPRLCVGNRQDGRPAVAHRRQLGHRHSPH